MSLSQDEVQLAYVLGCLKCHQGGRAPLVPDTFLHMLTLLKAIARSRPANLVTFAETHPVNESDSKCWVSY